MCLPHEAPQIGAGVDGLADTRPVEITLPFGDTEEIKDTGEQKSYQRIVFTQGYQLAVCMRLPNIN